VKPNKTKDFRVEFRPSTQPTRKFIKALKIKGYEFLFNESNRRALIRASDTWENFERILERSFPLQMPKREDQKGSMN
jgi:hypothetical protein